MMIGAPGAKVSRAVMSAGAPIRADGVYVCRGVGDGVPERGAHAEWSTFVSAFTSGADVGASVLTLISGFLAVTETAAGAWLHLLSLDLFVARHAFPRCTWECPPRVARAVLHVRTVWIPRAHADESGDGEGGRGDGRAIAAATSATTFAVTHWKFHELSGTRCFRFARVARALPASPSHHSRARRVLL